MVDYTHYISWTDIVQHRQRKNRYIIGIASIEIVIKYLGVDMGEICVLPKVIHNHKDNNTHTSTTWRVKITR